MSKQIFISYSNTDSEWARSFADALERHGLRVWLDKSEIQAGESWREALESGLRESDVVVALINPQTSFKANLYFELGAAIGMGKRVVPIVPREMDNSKLPFELRMRRYLVRESPENTAEQLADSLKAA
ncbi:MAG: toll/interleukin-1 receptor domain-containing protein [Pyrinomonadaceae bacterium]